MRLTPIRTASLLVLDDTYNANPGSVEAAFRTLAALPEGRKVVVLGDMLELGERAAELHRAAGAWMGMLDAALLVAVGEHADAVRQGALDKGFAAERIHVHHEVDSATRDLPGLVRDGDTILVKGSRGMVMERVVEALLRVGNGHAG